MAYGQFEQCIRNLGRVMGQVNTKLQRDLTLEETATRLSVPQGDASTGRAHGVSIRPAKAGYALTIRAEQSLDQKWVAETLLKAFEGK